MRAADEAEAMTSREKILNVEQQVRAMLRTGPAAFECPFCGLTTEPNQDVLCCDAAANVLEAIVEHLEFGKAIRTAEQAMDRLADIEAQERAKLICLN